MARLIELEDDELETITEMLREYHAALSKGEISSMGSSWGAGEVLTQEIAAAGRMIGKLERAAC
jgi:hypothetical protein